MAAPQFVPSPATDIARSYRSPDHVPDSWSPDRPGELVDGRQPSGGRFGYQGPDQGFGLTLAERFRDRLQLTKGEHVDDAMQGCLNIALRRASIYGRAPMVHDLTMAFTMWGFLDAAAPADLVAVRKAVFEGLGNAAHHYAEGRAVAAHVPEATLRMTPQALQAAYPASWRSLLGV